MRRKFIPLLVFALLLSVAPAVYADGGDDAPAEPDAVISVSVSTEGTLYPGDEFTVTLSTTELTFSGLGLDLVYDEDALTLLEISKTDIEGTLVTSRKPTRLMWAELEGKNLTYEGELASLTFQINSETPRGSYEIGVGYISTVNNKDVEPGAYNYTMEYIYNGIHPQPQSTPLNLSFASATLTVNEGLDVARLSGSGYQYRVTPRSASVTGGYVIGALYGSDGQMKDMQLQQVTAIGTALKTFTFRQAAAGDTVKFMWVSAAYAPVCPAVALDLA